MKRLPQRSVGRRGKWTVDFNVETKLIEVQTLARIDVKDALALAGAIVEVAGELDVAEGAKTMAEQIGAVLRRLGERLEGLS